MRLVAGRWSMVDYFWASHDLKWSCLQQLTYGSIDVYTVGHQDEAQLDASLGAVVKQAVAWHRPVDVQFDLLQYRLGLVVNRRRRIHLAALYCLARLFKYCLDLISKWGPKSLVDDLIKTKKKSALIVVGLNTYVIFGANHSVNEYEPDFVAHLVGHANFAYCSPKCVLAGEPKVL